MIEIEPLEPARTDGDTGSAHGALAVAGIATGLVIAMWFAFYFLVFVPRAPAP